ncbi:MAG TPA: hypothetical protein VN419_01160, partial [Humidesulfovibrio sp.]|nr:hypothetical protein [Humidesulfovibrio sp.]
MSRRLFKATSPVDVFSWPASFKGHAAMSRQDKTQKFKDISRKRANSAGHKRCISQRKNRRISSSRLIY